MATDPLSKPVGAVLMKDWDPIGIQDVPSAADEYHAYIERFTGLLRRHASISTLAENLLRIETEEIGLAGDRGRALRVASILRELHK